MAPLFYPQVESVRRAEENHTDVDHPLLDNVRACSSTPSAAADFFCSILHPSPTARLTSAQALEHPYLRRCVHQMQASYRASELCKASTESETPASAFPLTPDTHPHSTGGLGRFASVPSSGLKLIKVLVSQAMPGSSSSRSIRKARTRDMARYFPDYVHASSDAELSAYQPHADSNAPLLPKASHTDVRQLMASLNQLRTDFSLKPSVDAPWLPTAAVLPGFHPVTHVKASPHTDSAAAALRLQRQLYPAFPLSAGRAYLPYAEQPQPGLEDHTDSPGSGLIPAMHSSHAQPSNSCQGVSDAASGLQHSVTPGGEAAVDQHRSPTPPVHGPRPGSTQASCSKLYLMQAHQPSANSRAAAEAPGSAAQPPAAVVGTAKTEEERMRAEKAALVPGGFDQEVVEQRHSAMQELSMIKPEAEQASCLLTADAAGDSENRGTAVGHSMPGAFASQEALISHDLLAQSLLGGYAKDHEDMLRSHPIYFVSEDEGDTEGAQPSQPQQGLSLTIPAQAHVQLPDQHLGASKDAEDNVAITFEKPLKSHALHLSSADGEDLDVLGASDGDKSGSDSKCNNPAVEDADIAPKPLSPYLSGDIPLLQAQALTVPLYRSVPTIAYSTCCSYLHCDACSCTPL